METLSELQDIQKKRISIIKLGADARPILYSQNQNQVDNARDGYVPFGELDDQFKYLLDMYTASTTHNAICNNYVKYLFGHGLESEDIDSIEVQKINFDYYVFGNACAERIGGKWYHVPVQMIRAQKADNKGRVPFFGYSTDWDDNSIIPEQIPNWELHKNSKKKVLYYIKPYTPNAYYYSLVRFQGGLAYCEIERDLAQFHKNHIQHGFSGTKIVNFNNGQPEPNERLQIETDVRTQYTGVNGDNLIIAFNKSKEYAATVDDIAIGDAHSQFEFMSTEATDKIIRSHSVTSPLLVGVKDGGNGFSSNAEEMETSARFYFNLQVKPDQEFLAGHFSIMTGKPQSYKPLNPFEGMRVTEEKDEGVTTELKGQKFEYGKALILLGEDSLEGFELIHKNPVDYKTNNEDGYSPNKQSIVERLMAFADVKTGTAFPKGKSIQDTEYVKVRYRYRGDHGSEREFCKAMTRANKMYRFEDIDRMKNVTVNPGFGMSPFPDKPYDIWLWKGGGKLSDNYKFGTCRHYWEREIYLKIGVDVDPTSPLARTITESQARQMDSSFPDMDRRAGTAPHDM